MRAPDSKSYITNYSRARAKLRPREVRSGSGRGRTPDDVLGKINATRPRRAVNARWWWGGGGQRNGRRKQAYTNIRLDIRPAACRMRIDQTPRYIPPARVIVLVIPRIVTRSVAFSGNYSPGSIDACPRTRFCQRSVAKLLPSLVSSCVVYCAAGACEMFSVGN